jgi:hypothetical protein
MPTRRRPRSHRVLLPSTSVPEAGRTLRTSARFASGPLPISRCSLPHPRSSGRVANPLLRGGRSAYFRSARRTSSHMKENRVISRCATLAYDSHNATLVGAPRKAFPQRCGALRQLGDPPPNTLRAAFFYSVSGPASVTHRGGSGGKPGSRVRSAGWKINPSAQLDTAAATAWSSYRPQQRPRRTDGKTKRSRFFNRLRPLWCSKPPCWLGVPSSKSRARSTFERNAEVQKHFKIEAQVWLRPRPKHLLFGSSAQRRQAAAGR